MSVLWLSLTLGLVAGLADFLGGFLLVRRSPSARALCYFVALGAGFMLAAAVLEMILTGLMMAATFYSQSKILPAMEVDRALAGGVVEAAPPGNAGRIDFERLHILSERMEGFVFFCGLGVVFVLSRESQWPETGKIERT